MAIDDEKSVREEVTYEILSSPSVDLPYDKARMVFVSAWIGLIFSTVVAAACIACGALAKGASQQIKKSSIHFPIGLVPLLVNLIVLVCTESLGLIHGISLRWALFVEGRLEFNTNIRLFTFARTSWPNSRTVNLVYLVALALCYASSSVIIVNTRTNGYGDTVEVTKSGFFCLGGGLLVQVLVCFWCILSTKALSWSSNPLTTLAVARSKGIQAQRGRCMRSVHDQGLPSTPVRPCQSQKSIYAARPQVFKVILATGATLVGLLVWCALALWRGLIDGGTRWSILPDYSGDNQPPGLFLWLFGEFNGDGEKINGDVMLVGQIFFVVMIQLVITAGLHCSELLISLFRDEAIWRDSITRKGANANKSTILHSLTVWPALVLLLLKPVIHWLYGLSMLVDYNGIRMGAPQIVYLTILWALLVLFVSYVAFKKPAGPLPATYGHVQTLIDLVDQWSATMYWGHKTRGRGDDNDDRKIEGEVLVVCHAGTSSVPLPPVIMDQFYA